MRKLVSTHLFRSRRLAPAHLEQLQAAGVDGVELFCSRYSFDYRDPVQTGEIAAWLRDHGLAVHSLHSPIWFDEHAGRAGEPPVNIAARDARERLKALDEVLAALDFAARVPVRYLVQHLAPCPEAWDARKADAALGSVELLRLRAKQAGVVLLLENIPNELSTPERLMGFLAQAHLDDVGVCFDAGHAHMSAELGGGGGVLESWEHLHARVLSTHLHDNAGRDDGHLWPGDGTVSWPALAARLREKGDDFPWLLEVRDHGVEDLTARIQATFRHFETLARTTPPSAGLCPA